MWGERQVFEINNKPAKGLKTISRQNGLLIYHCIPVTIMFDFRVILLTENYHTNLFLLLKKTVREMLGRNHILVPRATRLNL